MSTPNRTILARYGNFIVMLNWKRLHMCKTNKYTILIRTNLAVFVYFRDYPIFIDIPTACHSPKKSRLISRGSLFALPPFPDRPSIATEAQRRKSPCGILQYKEYPVACFSKKKPPTFVGGLCSRYLSSRVGQGLSLRKNMPVACFSKKKPPTFVGGLCSRYLSSRAVTRQVLSAYMSLTSVFGMGTGGPS